MQTVLPEDYPENRPGYGGEKHSAPRGAVPTKYAWRPKGSAASAASGAGGEPEGASASAASGAGAERYFHIAIRACSGHTYPFIRTDRLCAPISEEKLSLLSTLVHVTQWENVRAILSEGLIPGGGVDG